MGAELSDITINYAQELLKLQFQELNGLQSTLLQEKKMELSEAQIKKQTANHPLFQKSSLDCSIYCRLEVQIYDSLFYTIDKETRSIIQNLFQVRSGKSLTIKLVQCQKQTGGKDCSLCNSNCFSSQDNKFPSIVNEGSFGGVSEQKAHVTISL